MKLKFSFLSLLFVTIFGMLSCGKMEDPTNFIADPEGVTIELTWTNGATDPTDGVDLDLYVRKNFNSLLQSEHYSKFESIDISPSILNNGTYSLEVSVHDCKEVTNYTLKITGKSTDKTYSDTFGPINASDNYGTLKPWNLTIAGDKYSVSR
jgi:hypothetical protein